MQVLPSPQLTVFSYPANQAWQRPHFPLLSEQFFSLRLIAFIPFSPLTIFVCMSLLFCASVNASELAQDDYFPATSMKLSYALDEEELSWIGERIYANECASKPENLIHWNRGEDFPSLGIGHFIWYRANQTEKFVETFPKMVAFVAHKNRPPEWLMSLSNLDSPWQTKVEFLRFKQTQNYQELLDWLLASKTEQAEFITHQLRERFTDFWQESSNLQAFATEETQIRALFARMLQFKQGRFALIDYANFKGIGSQEERYQGEQWGLVSVLQQMLVHSPEIDQASDSEILQHFVISAKARLQTRVDLAPKARNEGRWLRGWFKRLEGYL